MPVRVYISSKKKVNKAVKGHPLQQQLLSLGTTNSSKTSEVELVAHSWYQATSTKLFSLYLEAAAVNKKKEDLQPLED